MKTYCDVIRDLLPLYADQVCSETSRELVEKHLAECPDCRAIVSNLMQTEIEDRLHEERDSVLEYGIREFRRRTAAVGSAGFMIPVALCLTAGLFLGPSTSWVSVVMASVCVLASLIVVPILVTEDKLFWTFCAFCASLVLLLGVICLYSHGDWFRIASSGVLFGLSVPFLPFVLKAKPVKKLIGERNRLLIVLGVDAALLFNLLSAVDTRGELTLSNLLFTVGALGGIACVVLGIVKSRKQKE